MKKNTNRAFLLQKRSSILVYATLAVIAIGHLVFVAVYENNVYSSIITLTVDAAFFAGSISIIAIISNDQSNDYLLRLLSLIAFSLFSINIAFHNTDYVLQLLLGGAFIAYIPISLTVLSRAERSNLFSLIVIYSGGASILAAIVYSAFVLNSRFYYFEIFTLACIFIAALIAQLYKISLTKNSDAINARALSVLQDIIPSAMLHKILLGDKNISNRYDSLTIMFADLVDFTSASAKWEKHSPEVILKVLDALFGNFDSACKRNGCEKIKTLGDGYMAVKGLNNESTTDSVTGMFEMAREMKKIIDLINKSFNSDIGLRIGINTGPVIAGVIGKTKASFDIWGRAVNVASRLESKAQRNGVMMSEISFALLKNRSALNAERVEVELHGVGKVSAYSVKL